MSLNLGGEGGGFAVKGCGPSLRTVPPSRLHEQNIVSDVEGDGLTLLSPGQTQDSGTSGPGQQGEERSCWMRSICGT